MPSITAGATSPGRTRRVCDQPLLPPIFLRGAFLMALILLPLCLLSRGQQPSHSAPMPDSPSASQEQQAPSQPGRMQATASFVSVLMTRSIVFPDLATSAGPLSPGQKFKLFVAGSIAPSTFVAAAGGACINQAADVPAGYGSGGEGYAKRFGSILARSASSRLVGTFLLASALHEDPRFFVRSDLKLGGSVKYSIRRVFITRSDSGKPVFNWSGLLGPLAAEGLANVYFPDSYRTAGNTFGRYGHDLGVIAAANLLRQYWPRINKRLKTVPQSPSAAPSDPAKP